MLLPCAHAQRGKVIGSIVIVVITKIARSRVLGVSASVSCRSNVGKKRENRVRHVPAMRKAHES